VKVLLIRHGEVVFDLERIRGGDLDPELTEKGRKQIRELAKKIKARFGNSRVALYSSPAKRAKESAEIIRQELKIPKIIFRDRLKDADSSSSLSGPETVELITQEKDRVKKWIAGQLKKVESHTAFLARTRKEIDYLKEVSGKKKFQVVIIAAHGETIWALETILKGVAFPEAIKTKVDFASLWEYEI
jgi:broad specificity phosphatase PhoE